MVCFILCYGWTISLFPLFFCSTTVLQWLDCTYLRCMCVGISVGWISRSGVAGSQDKCIVIVMTSGSKFPPPGGSPLLRHNFPRGRASSFSPWNLHPGKWVSTWWSHHLDRKMPVFDHIGGTCALWLTVSFPKPILVIATTPPSGPRPPPSTI